MTDADPIRGCLSPPHTRTSSPTRLAPVRSSSELTILPCARSHAFHSECINKWLERHTTCPLCRTDTRSLLPSASAPAAAPRPDSGGGGATTGPPPWPGAGGPPMGLGLPPTPQAARALPLFPFGLRARVPANTSPGSQRFPPVGQNAGAAPPGAEEAASLGLILAAISVPASLPSAGGGSEEDSDPQALGQPLSPARFVRETRRDGLAESLQDPDSPRPLNPHAANAARNASLRDTVARMAEATRTAHPSGSRPMTRAARRELATAVAASSPLGTTLDDVRPSSRREDQIAPSLSGSRARPAPGRAPRRGSRFSVAGSAPLPPPPQRHGRSAAGEGAGPEASGVPGTHSRRSADEGGSASWCAAPASRAPGVRRTEDDQATDPFDRPPAPASPSTLRRRRDRDALSVARQRITSMFSRQYRHASAWLSAIARGGGQPRADDPAASPGDDEPHPGA